MLLLLATLALAAPGPDEAPVSPEAAPAPPVLLVLPTRPVDLEAAWGEQVTHELARAAAADGRFRVLASSDLKELSGYLQDQQALGCEEQSACLARVAELSAARWLLGSTVGRVGGQLVLNVSLVDTVDVAGGRRASRSAADAPALLASVDAAVRELLGVGSAAPAVAHAVGGKFSCAVLDLRASGVPPDVADNLTQVLSTAIRTLDGAQVISRDDVTAMLDQKARSQLVGCDDTACMAEIGGALGVDKLVVGSVGQLGAAYVISLRLVDIASAAVDNRITESFTAAAEQLLGAVRKAAYDLFGVKAGSPGELIMSVSEAGAEVFVDDAKVGTSPLPPIANLAAGRHHLRVAKPGFRGFTTDLYVDGGATTGQWVQLEEIPEPWYEKWWVWTAAGVVVAGGIAAAVVAAQPQAGGLEVTTDVPGRWR